MPPRLCCCQPDCFDILFSALQTDDGFNSSWNSVVKNIDEFEINDLTFSSDPFGYFLQNGEQLKPKPITKGANEWFHEIRIEKGDVDLSWDGIKIEMRAGAGTIKVLDGATTLGESIFITSVDVSGLVLWVTPTWFAVSVAKPNFDVQEENHGGSVQVFNRSNVDASHDVTLTSVGESQIQAWRIVNANAKVTGGYLYGDLEKCPGQPYMPRCTLRFMESQSPMGEAYTAAIDANVSTRIKDWNDPDTECQPSEVTKNYSQGLSDLNATGCGSGTQFELPFEGEFDSFAGYPLTRECLIDASGNSRVIPDQTALLPQNHTLLVPSAAYPHPKPQSRFRLTARGPLGTECLPLAFHDLEAFVEFDNDGFASFQGAAAVELEDDVHPDCGLLDGFVRERNTGATVQWSAG